MKTTIPKILIFMGIFFQLSPCKNAYAEEFVDAKTLGMQASIYWQQTYHDVDDREIVVDIQPIIPNIEVVPVIKIRKPEYTVESIYNICDPSKTNTTEESFGTILNYSDSESGEQLEARFFKNGDKSIFVEYTNQKTKIESDPNKLESFNGDTYCSNKVERTQAYLEGYDLTVQECLDMANERLTALFPTYNIDLDLTWVEVVPNSRPCYVCTLKQKIKGIPVLMGAGDPVVGISDNEINFKKPDSWKRSETFRWGDFFSPMWDFIAYVDGGYQIQCAPLTESSVVEYDIPLCNMEKVIQSIEERIENGYIRNVHALRFGYCCYIDEENEIVLYPIWEVECDYYYNPNEETKQYGELEDVPITSRLQYRTMIVNAQTGEFMDPIELKDRLLDCPEIITWDDVQS